MARRQDSSISWAFGGAVEAAPVQSSNRYANGSNQNCGNVITGRSSTRVHAAPGGNSSISFGSYEAVAPKALAAAPAAAAAASSSSSSSEVTFGARIGKTSSNSFAVGANQNCGNVITDRSSTRVHAPPGGRSQISFGSQEPIIAPKSVAAAAAAAPSAATLKDTTTSQNVVAPTEAPIKSDAVFGARIGKTSSNSYASGANQNCGNVITDRSSTRVHAPPGGKTSFILG
jgi:SPIRAL1-like protein